MATTACDHESGTAAPFPVVSASDRVVAAQIPSNQLGHKELELLEEKWRLNGDFAELTRIIAAYEAAAAAEGCTGTLTAASLRSEQLADSRPIHVAMEALSASGGCQELVRKTKDLLQPVEALADPPTKPQETGAAGADSTTPLQIRQLERYGAEDSARIVILLSRPALYEVGQLPARPGQGPRLFVDIAGADYSGENEFPVGGIVRRVRVGQHDSGLRVVLDLREHVYKQIFYLPEPFRLVVDVSVNPPQLTNTGARGSRKLSRVVLDPGHGGHDPGAIGASGLQEKDVALDVAHRAAPLIARELGVNALLTRDTDEFVALDERVARANAFQADLFVSIHCNASESTDSHGIMTFVLDHSRDSLAQNVAARENDASAAAGQQLASAMREVMDLEGLARSAHFAQLLQRASIASLLPGHPDTRDGGVRRAGFYVLAGAQMPAVLFESSFISNPSDERRLDDAGYRQKLADAIVNAIRAYKIGM